MTIIDKLVELIRETASSLPEDVLAAIRAAKRREEAGSSATVVLETILANCALAKETQVPLCQDTGTLTFFVDEALRSKVTPEVIRSAVRKATALGYLRKNCIDSVTGKSYDDNCAEGAPVVHYVDGRRGAESAPYQEGANCVEGRRGAESAPYQEGANCVEGRRGAESAPYQEGANCVEGRRGAESAPYRSARDLTSTPPHAVTLLLKGGGSENMSRQYSLPDSSLGAGRDLAGVRKCVLDAVQKIQGYGCAPGILGICIGGDRATGYEVAKEQLLRRLDEGVGTRPVDRVYEGDDESVDAVYRPRPLARLEKALLREANDLGIGPMGLGGKTTLLGVKIAARPRVPASFFVTIAYMCWACRRRTAFFE